MCSYIWFNKFCVMNMNLDFLLMEISLEGTKSVFHTMSIMRLQLIIIIIICNYVTVTMVLS